MTTVNETIDGTVEEYVKMAEKAAEDNAHVAVLTHYRDAIDITEYGPTALPILMAAIQYAPGLKKKMDRKAIAQWGQESIGIITENIENLTTMVNNGIVKLKGIGKDLEIS